MAYPIQKISTFLLFFLLNISLSAQESREEKLVNLLISGRYFEAREFYGQAEKDSVFAPFYRLYYQYETAKLQCKNDSAAVFLEQLLKDGDKYWGGWFKFRYYEQLWDLYTYILLDYEKALFTCERMRQYLEENPFGVDVEENIKTEFFRSVEDKKKLILKRYKNPAIKISRQGANKAVKIKDDDELLFFDAAYNNKTITTLFDTGTSLYIAMNEKMADSIGVKRIGVFEDGYSHQINNEILTLDEGMIDSMEIANFKFYNLPVIIYRFDPRLNIPESIYNRGAETQEILQKNLEYFSNSMKIVLGYPIMSLMKKIIVDFDNKELSFPDDLPVCANNMNASNIFVHTPNLYTRLSINDSPLTVHVDFGSTSYMQLHSSFYERNRDKIPVKATAEKESLNIAQLHNMWLDVPYEIPENPVLKFNGRVIPPKKDNLIQIYSLPGQQVQETFDGHVGYPFFKNLGKKILLDFENMRIDVVE